jgi:hypothetical protein
VSTSGGDGTEGPLAEFAALRQEIIQRQATQHSVLALQLTISGAVFSFALKCSPPTMADGLSLSRSAS